MMGRHDEVDRDSSCRAPMDEVVMAGDRTAWRHGQRESGCGFSARSRGAKIGEDPWENRRSYRLTKSD